MKIQLNLPPTDVARLLRDRAEKAETTQDWDSFQLLLEHALNEAWTSGAAAAR